MGLLQAIIDSITEMYDRFVRNSIRGGMNIAPALVHMLAAAIFAFIGFEIAIAATLVYLLYQYLDHVSGSEPIEDTQIDLVEWLIGLLVGSILAAVGW